VAVVKAKGSCCWKEGDWKIITIIIPTSILKDVGKYFRIHVHSMATTS
jgi:hypothetical protein